MRSRTIFILGLALLTLGVRSEVIWLGNVAEALIVAGKYITEGLVPYRDFWSYYGPNLHYIYALIYAVGGPSYLGLNLVMASGICWIVVWHGDINQANSCRAQSVFGKALRCHNDSSVGSCLSHTDVFWNIGTIVSLVIILFVACASIYRSDDT